MKLRQLLMLLFFVFGFNLYGQARAANQNALNGEQGDKFIVEMLAGGVGGFMAWGFTAIVTFVLTRRRLIAYLVITYNAQVREYRDTEKLLSDVVKKYIKKDSVIDFDAAYTKGDLTDFTELRPQCLTYLKKNELIRFTEITHRLIELEALLDGFFSELTRYKTEGTALKDEDVVYWETKHGRIQCYFNLIPKQISRIGDLPVDYSTIIGADAFINSTKADSSQIITLT